MKVTKLLLVVAIFGLGYMAPQLLQFEKKMEFVQIEQSFKQLVCQVVDNRCSVAGYRLKLISGSFATLERTTFKLTYKDRPVSSDILVTSDDNQFGTLLSQKTGGNARSVLIPYCGNPVMNVILVDKQGGVGLFVVMFSD